MARRPLRPPALPQLRPRIADAASRLRGGEPERAAPAIFLIAVLLVGTVASLSGPRALRGPQGGGSLRDGSWADAYQRELDEGSALREPALHLWTALRLALFREARPGALVGADGWLYTREEFAWGPDAPANMAANLDAIAAADAALAAGGAELLVVLVPSKARTHPEGLGRLEPPEAVEARYRAALAGLAERGVLAADPLEEMRSVADGAAFLRTDTHWTPAGAARAARAAADAAAGAGVLPDAEPEPFETRRTGVTTHRGDLLAFLPLGRFHDLLAPPDDRLARVETRSLAPPSTDLFATAPEDAPPIALVGTSYSADERWNFAGALREAFASDLVQAAASGRGPFAPMRAWLEGEAWRRAPPELVVWEIPERYLGLAWEEADALRALAAAGPGAGAGPGAAGAGAAPRTVPAPRALPDAP